MIYLMLTMFFLLLLGFFSGIETGLISIRMPRLHHNVSMKVKGAMIIDFFLTRSTVMLSTLLIGTNFCLVCASLAAKRAALSFGLNENTAMIVSVCALTLMLLLTEIVAKSWFRENPYDRCLFFSYPLYLSYIVFYVPVRFFASLSSAVVRIAFPAGGASSSKLLLREDFRMLLRESQHSGILEPDAAEILDNSIDFYALKADDIKVPADKVRTGPASLSVREAMDFCKRNGLSRMPVSMDEAGKIKWIGVFSVYDAIFMIPEAEWDNTRVIHCLRPLKTISAAASAAEVIETARRMRSPLLAVTDPKDSSVYRGVVTPIDVVKNLFG